MSARVDQVLNQIESLTHDELQELKQRLPDELILSDWDRLSRQVLERRRQAGLPPQTQAEVLEECRRLREEAAEFLETGEFEWPTNIDEVIELAARINAKYARHDRV